ncbi:MAG: aminotransferase class I/II-fold pyridoxal phosphate-dependent enzyme [Pseudomonadota bacterium]
MTHPPKETPGRRGAPPESPSQTGLRAQTLAVSSPAKPREVSGDVATAIHLSTTFEHGPAYERLHGYSYARDDNPNVRQFETQLGQLEGAGDCVAFASGVAAGAALAQTLPPGARVIFHRDTYLDFQNMVGAFFPRWQLTADFVDMTDLDDLAQALAAPCALVWLETPSNPCLDIIDIAAVVALAKPAGAKVVVDGTFASPAAQMPIALGADYCLQAATKYIGGHSDVMGGALSCREETDGEALRDYRKLTGAVMAPFSAWLAARGLQTLFCRIAQQSQTAAYLATRLAAHPAVSAVHYPGLPNHPGHAIAQQQMINFGAMVSFELCGGAPAALKTTAAVQLFTTATSLGGVESLIEHRASVEGGVTTTPPGLLRASIGLEHEDDLWADLENALPAS